MSDGGMRDGGHLLSRREAVGRLAAAGSAALVSGPLAAATPAAPGLIRAENERPGTRDWMLTKVEVDPATKYRSPAIEGFCSHASIRAGETLSIFVSTRPASRFTIDIYRTGFYGGTGGRLMASLGEFPGVAQPDPPVGPKRLRRCEWPAATELKIPADWPSGVYVGKLTEKGGGRQSYVIFIVRDDRPADFIFQCSDLTWQAYNRWPDQFSLYDDGVEKWYWGAGVQVGFDRPYGKYCQLLDQPLSVGSGEWFLWEFPLAFWMESQGYDVSYVSNLDTHRDPAGLLRAHGFLSVGHDEYWTIEMFRNVQAALAAGVNLAFLSGNAVYGRVLLDERQRAFERVGVFGPPHGTREFVKMSTLPHERPYGNELMGAHTTGAVTGLGDWVCTLPDHWIHAGTGLGRGDTIPGLIGWEYHGDPAPIPGLEVVATGPTASGVKKNGKNNLGVYTATCHPGPRGNFVFNAATCYWPLGLAAPPGLVLPQSLPGADARVARMTRNLLDRMLATAPPVRGAP
jgi:hypothetical protein